jgi:hypothetical protein
MKVEELSKNILLLDSKIRFAGLIERTGHMFAGGEREGLEEYLKDTNVTRDYIEIKEGLISKKTFAEV